MASNPLVLQGDDYQVEVHKKAWPGFCHTSPVKENSGHIQNIDLLVEVSECCQQTKTNTKQCCSNSYSSYPGLTCPHCLALASGSLYSLCCTKFFSFLLLTALDDLEYQGGSVLLVLFIGNVPVPLNGKFQGRSFHSPIVQAVSCRSEEEHLVPNSETATKTN